MAETKKNSFLFRMTVRTCFLLYYNFCLWNYVKELVPTRDFPGPQGPRLPHLRVQRYNISTNHQNNQPLFLKKICITSIPYIILLMRATRGYIFETTSRTYFAFGRKINLFILFFSHLIVTLQSLKILL